MIEFIDEPHIYLFNGVILPSVSSVLRKYLFKDKYKDVPERVLMNKAKYGTEVHKLIEDYENQKEYKIHNVYQELSFNQYLDMKKKYSIEVLEQEKIVHYKYLYAGRFDMIATIDGKLCLCDIKTTAELDKEYLSWQLSLYEYAYGKKFDKLYAIWLPKKGVAELVEIERKSEEEIKKLMSELEKDNEKDE